jgi:hypothetical protein
MWGVMFLACTAWSRLGRKPWPPSGKMIRAPAFRQDSDSEKKLTIAPSATGTLKKLTP